MWLRPPHALEKKAVLLITGRLAAAINTIDWMILGNPDPNDFDAEEFVKVYGDVSLADEVLQEKNVEPVCRSKEFEGTATSISPRYENSFRYDNEYLCCIPCAKEANLFSAAYADIAELKKEFEAVLEKYDLKKFVEEYDIDIEEYIVEISGTYI